MKFTVICFSFLSLFALWLWTTLVEPYLLVTYDETNICLSENQDDLDGLKIAIISDVHFGNSFFEVWRLQNIVKKANSANADVIVLIGDYVSSYVPFGQLNLSTLSHNLAKLKAPLGVYCSLGNHDSYYGVNKIRQCLKNAKIPILENSNIEVKRGDKSFYFAGLADVLTQYYSFTQTFKNIPEKKSTILLSHSPDAFGAMPMSSNIMFSGHTHGGQIKLPFLGAMFVNLKLEKIADGKLERAGKVLYVSRGLGTSRIPARFLCPPTIVIATISK